MYSATRTFMREVVWVTAQAGFSSSGRYGSILQWPFQMEAAVQDKRPKENVVCLSKSYFPWDLIPV